MRALARILPWLDRKTPAPSEQKCNSSRKTISLYSCSSWYCFGDRVIVSAACLRLLFVEPSLWNSPNLQFFFTLTQTPNLQRANKIKKHLQSETKSSMAMEALLVSPIPVLMGVLSTSSNSSVPSILGSPWSSRMVTCTVWYSEKGGK